ncbi:hypothetical protein [Methylobacterium sp. J-070]|uniref:hypothetical protein n=1 Tax=Methylobacterium sp. J-070 TaxID=2836650 RepID=UPI001FB8CB2D|nr:hypothetical protein [Methylobacterium sp. J-070]MCJ2054096.1 hypothetical protein [Methylobacterium sp. J-070]
MADGYGIVGEPVTLLRITLPGEPPLPRRRITESGLSVLELEARDEGSLAELVLGQAAAAEDDLVLDLPGLALGYPSLRERVDAPVMPVGATPLHEYLAAVAIATASPAAHDGPAMGVPWLLGCGRSGGVSAADAFARAMRRHADLAPRPERVRTLPMTVPALSRGEAERILEGDRTARSLTISLALLAVLRVAGALGSAATVDLAAYAKALGEDAERATAPDTREAGERLLDLADALNGIQDRVSPTLEDLEAAPRLERWSVATRQVRVLTGEVYGHPNFANGRRISTSDLYATDGKTWARSLSRWFALGEPARKGAGSAFH